MSTQPYLRESWPALPKASTYQEQCAWCWRTRSPLIPFPPNISSCCCTEHRARLMSGLAEKREARERVKRGTL